MPRATALIAFLATMLLSACVTAASVAPRGSGDAPSVESLTTSEPGLATEAPDVSPKPFQQSFGPDYAAAVPAGPFNRLDAAALLSRDRRTLTVQFVGGKAYTPTNECSVDYKGWASIDGNTLSVAVEEVGHPEQALRTPVPCTMEGYGYLFALNLPAPFTGSMVRDLGSGRLWVPPPERVAEPVLLPVGWRLFEVSGSEFSALDPKQLGRSWGAATAPVTGPSSVITLIQAFGGQTDYVGGYPTATALVHGSNVDVRNDGGGDLSISWMLDGDGFTLISYRPTLPVDELVVIANAVAVPSAEVPAPS